MIMQAQPPIMYQVWTPSQSDTGPATCKLSGDIADPPEPSIEKTRPCISGSKAACKMASKFIRSLSSEEWLR